MYTSYQKERLNNRWPTIPPILKTRRLTSHTHSLSTEKTTTCDVANPNHVYMQCIRLLRNTFIVRSVMNCLVTKHQWLSNKEHSFTLCVTSSFRCTALTKKNIHWLFGTNKIVLNSPHDLFLFNLQQHFIVKIGCWCACVISILLKKWILHLT